MRDTRHGLTSIGLALLAVLGIMTFTAIGAQAQLPGASTPGAFLVNLGSALLATLAGSQMGTASLLFPSRSFKIDCTSSSVGGKINTSTDAQLMITFSGCLTLAIPTNDHIPCELKTLQTITMSTLVLPIAHGGESFLLLEPLPGNTSLTTISFKSGTGCTLFLNMPITGSISALVDALDAVKSLVLFNPAIQLLTGDVMSFGGHSIYVDSHVALELTGVHAGQKLGIH